MGHKTTTRATPHVLSEESCDSIRRHGVYHAVPAVRNVTKMQDA